MGRLVAGFVAMREADLANPKRQEYWRANPEEAVRRRAENSAFRAMTPEETDSLEKGGSPTPERIEQIACKSGLEPDHVERVLRGFVYLMTEGLRPPHT